MTDLLNEWRRSRRSPQERDRRCPEAKLIASRIDLHVLQAASGPESADALVAALVKGFDDPSPAEQIAAAVGLRKALLRRMDDPRLLQELLDLRTRYFIAVGGTAPTPPQPPQPAPPDSPARDDAIAEAENLWDQLQLVYTLTHERNTQIDTMRSIALVALVVVIALLGTLALSNLGLFTRADHQRSNPGAQTTRQAAETTRGAFIPAAWTTIALTDGAAGTGTGAGTPAVGVLPKEAQAAPAAPPVAPKDAAAGAARQERETYPPKPYSSQAQLNALLNCLIVAIAASAGAIVSILQRMHVAATLDPLAADPVRQISALRLGRTGLIAGALMGPASGLVLILAFASGAVKFASITPAFVVCDSRAASGFIFLNHCAAAATGGDAALIVVWSFVAGFAERLVPDVLDRFVKAVKGS